MTPLNASVRQAWASDDSGKGGPGILVVDDDAETRRVICEALNHQGFTRVFQAGDGAECLSMYQQHADVIRALVLDVMMPNMSGAHVLDGLTKIKPQALGVLLMSGHADSLAAVSERYRADGGSFYLETLGKPFQLPELSACVKRILMRQGGPSALVGSGVLATPGAARVPLTPRETGGDTTYSDTGGSASLRGQVPGPPVVRTDFARLEKQLADVETRLAGVVGAVALLRHLVDEYARSQG